MTRFDYHRPRSLGEALDLIARIPSARFIAGGTDLMVRIKNRELRPAALISLRAIGELAGIETRPATRIGAMTTITDIVEHRGLRERFPALIQAARRLGSVQIRNSATIGGNLCNCSPCADTAPPLLVHEARVALASPAGTREIPLREFLVGPGKTCSPPDEILTAILLGNPGRGERSTFIKKGRVKMDLAIASLAALLQMDGDRCLRARLAAGSVAPVCLRLEAAERLLEGQTLDPALADRAARKAAESVSPISDIRASADYRRHLVGVYVRRAVGELLGWSEA